ncbi:MAG: DUF2809 domain-containing protein [Specibacter sp.]
MPAAQNPTPRRLALFIAAAAVIVLGLALHFLARGEAANFITDALFTVMVYLLIGLIVPAAGRWWLAVGAFVLSTLIEISQLTGVPARLAEVFPPSRLVLGTTFSAPDIAAYALGAAAAWGADRLLSGLMSARRRTWLASRSE